MNTQEETKLSPKENMKRLQREWYLRNKDKVNAKSKEYYHEKYKEQMQRMKQELQLYKDFYDKHNQQQLVS